MFSRFAGRTCSALLMLALAPCAGGTKLVNSWKAPDAAPLSVKQGDLVIAMVMSKQETTRRTGEDLLGEELRQRGLRPIPSFTLIPTDQVDDREKAALPSRTRVRSRSSRCARSPSTSSRPTSRPATWGRALMPAAGGRTTATAGGCLQPGLRGDRHHRSRGDAGLRPQAKQARLGRQSETTNPDRLDQFMRDLVKAAGADMRRKGVIAEPAS
jgi:hypothetical protein